MVGARRGELVEQVALRAHHFDAVVPRLARKLRAAHECTDLALDADSRECARLEGIDRCLERARCDLERVVGVAAGMEDLQADACAVRMHGCGDLAMPAHLPWHRERARKRLQPAAHVRREAAGHHQSDATLRAFGEIGGELREVARVVLEARVHRAHEDAVAERAEAKVERGEQVRIARMGQLGGHAWIRARTVRARCRESAASTSRRRGSALTGAAHRRMCAWQAAFPPHRGASCLGCGRRQRRGKPAVSRASAAHSIERSATGMPPGGNFAIC